MEENIDIQILHHNFKNSELSDQYERIYRTSEGYLIPTYSSSIISNKKRVEEKYVYKVFSKQVSLFPVPKNGYSMPSLGVYIARNYSDGFQYLFYNIIPKKILSTLGFDENSSEQPDNVYLCLALANFLQFTDFYHNYYHLEKNDLIIASKITDKKDNIELNDIDISLRGSLFESKNNIQIIKQNKNMFINIANRIVSLKQNLSDVLNYEKKHNLGTRNVKIGYTNDIPINLLDYEINLIQKFSELKKSVFSLSKTHKSMLEIYKDIDLKINECPTFKIFLKILPHAKELNKLLKIMNKLRDKELIRTNTEKHEKYDIKKGSVKRKKKAPTSSESKWKMQFNNLSDSKFNIKKTFENQPAVKKNNPNIAQTQYFNPINNNNKNNNKIEIEGDSEESPEFQFKNQTRSKSKKRKGKSASQKKNSKKTQETGYFNFDNGSSNLIIKIKKNLKQEEE